MSTDTYACHINFAQDANTPQPTTGSIGVSGSLVNSQNNGISGNITLTLSDNCLFRTNNLPELTVTTDQSGVFSEEYFTSSKVVMGGTITATPTNGGTPDSKPFSFENNGMGLNMTLDVNPERQVGDSQHKIAVTATITENGHGVSAWPISFTLGSTENVYFEDTGRPSTAATTNDMGVATVYLQANITDKEQDGRVIAQPNNRSPTPPAMSKPFTFTPPGPVSATLTCNNDGTFVAVDGSIQFTVVVKGAQSEAVPNAKVEFDIEDGQRAYFELPLPPLAQRCPLVVVTGPDGTATVTVKSSTWTVGRVVATVAFDKTEKYPDALPVSPGPVQFSATIPVGLTLIQKPGDYLAPSSSGTDTWLGYAGSAPATLSSRVQMEAYYWLNGAKWKGYGEVWFSVDPNSNAVLAVPTTTSLGPTFGHDPIMTIYNDPGDTAVKPSAQEASDALAWVSDEHLETVTISASQNWPLSTNLGLTADTAQLVFASPWASVSQINVAPIGGASSSLSVYNNGLNQVAIRVDLKLCDGAGVTLKSCNQPKIEDVANVITLSDATVTNNNWYLMPWMKVQDVVNSAYKYVTVFDESNIFLVQSNNQTPENTLIYSATDPTSEINDGVATLYYYIAIRPSENSSISSTQVGMQITPNYWFGALGPNGKPQTTYFRNTQQPSTYVIPATAANTVIIKSSESFSITEKDVDTVYSVGPVANQKDDRPVNFAGNDTIENYSRIWNFDISLTGNRTLKGAFIVESGDAPVATPNELLSDIKHGLYQIKLYAWPDSVYTMSDAEYEADQFDLATKLTVTAPRKVTLTGLPDQTVGNPSSGKVRVTVAVGFGDLTTWTASNTVLQLKLVDQYGNYGDFYIDGNGIGEPANLLTAMPKWTPLKEGDPPLPPKEKPRDNATTGSPTPLPRNFVLSRFSTTDSQNVTVNGESNLSVQKPNSKISSEIGGMPFQFLSGPYFTLTPVGNALKNNEQFFTLSCKKDGNTYYCQTFTGKNNGGKEGVTMVANLTSPGSEDYIQFKPCWNSGAAFIFGRAKTAALTDGTYWQWDATTSAGDNPLPDVTIYASIFGENNITVVALWVLDVQAVA